jgi:hypothetical protein
MVPPTFACSAFRTPTDCRSRSTPAQHVDKSHITRRFVVEFRQSAPCRQTREDSCQSAGSTRCRLVTALQIGAALICSSGHISVNATWAATAAFLERVKDLHPRAMRIVLTGHTELDAIVNAINRGAVHRYYIKPWNDEGLRANIRDAFRHHPMAHHLGDGPPVSRAADLPPTRQRTGLEGTRENITLHRALPHIEAWWTHDAGTAT